MLPPAHYLVAPLPNRLDILRTRMTREDLLRTPVDHVDIRAFDARPLIDAGRKGAFQLRNLSRAAGIFNEMMQDRDCGVILTLAGSLVSAGMKGILIEMIECNMVDAIVSTGANIVDQDFFEALGFKHYLGNPQQDDNQLRELSIDRIYDTYIDEEELRVCDMTVAEIANELEPRPWSSRAFIHEMGRFLDERDGGRIPSIIHTCYRKQVPIFVPAFSDCSAGFGLVHHQWNAKGPYLSIDSVADFRELTQLKLVLGDTGIFMIGGGVPKNFTQDVVVATDILGEEQPMHKYAIQLTVADERDGALSGSTLQEACSWGKVETNAEQMVFGEATITLPLLISDAWHREHWMQRIERRLNEEFDI